MPYDADTTLYQKRKMLTDMIQSLKSI